MAAVRTALEKGDVKTALTVLKSIGAMKQPKPGPTTVSEARREQSLKRRKHDAKKRREEFDITMDELMPG